MRRGFLWSCLLICLLSLAACSGGRAMTEGIDIKTPLKGDAHLRLGMEKDEVGRVWGDPDVINIVGYDEVGSPKEEWIYFGQLTKVPVNYQYFSKTKYLYFDSGRLVSFGEEEKEFKNDRIEVKNE